MYHRKTFVCIGEKGSDITLQRSIKKPEGYHHYTAFLHRTAKIVDHGVIHVEGNKALHRWIAITFGNKHTFDLFLLAEDEKKLRIEEE